MLRCARLLAVLGVAATLLLAGTAFAQSPRNFPQNALRGSLLFGAPPSVVINGNVGQLAPGVRIHGLDNMIKMSGALSGSQFLVNYTVERSTGLVQEVWLLRDDEAARQPWPQTFDDAARWSFDPASQTWTKP
jgi:hypothetical protein